MQKMQIICSVSAGKEDVGRSTHEAHVMTDKKITALYSVFFSVMTTFLEGFALMSVLCVFFCRVCCVLCFNCTFFSL